MIIEGSVINDLDHSYICTSIRRGTPFSQLLSFYVSNNFFLDFQAQEKGVSVTLIGVIMATSEIVMVLLAPVYGNFVT